MSADNWAICPQCHKSHREPASKYGKVSEEQYLAEIAKPKQEEPRTLREDYEVGTDETGEFYVQYSCSCSVCGLSFEFTTKQDVPLNGTKARK